MALSPQDEQHLSRALDLAREAAAFASPNPTVGCVLTQRDQTIGEGAHHYDAFDHAEIAALKDAAFRGHPVEGATAYVTLEPCSHHGRTGPCSEALVAAGISRCVVATGDPNPQVSGQGLARLRAANINTVLLDPSHPLAQQARRLNDAFAFAIQHGRPFVTLKSALSVDGKLAPAPSQRTATAPHWLTGDAARADVQNLRHASDAILTGIGTILADNPSLTDRTGLPRRRPLLRIVLDSHLRTPLDAQLIASAQNDVLLLCRENALASQMAALRERGVEVVTLPGQLSAQATLAALEPRRILSILVEAGSAVNASFLSANLADKAVLYFSETELGSSAIPFARGGPSPFTLQQQLRQATRKAFPHGPTEDVRITGYIHDPWADIQ